MWKRQADLATRLTMRGYLVLLTLAILLPVLVFSGVLYLRYYNAEQERIESDLLNDARQLALTVDRDLAGLLNTLQTLATSTRLAENDYAGFYQQAERVRAMLGLNILLRDTSGQQIANTRLPWGATLPFEPLAGDKQVLETRRPIDLGRGRRCGGARPLFTITVPRHTRRPRHAFYQSQRFARSACIESSAGNLRHGAAPGSWIPHGIILARQRTFRGAGRARAAPNFLSPAPRDRAGVWRGTNTSGEAVRTAYARAVSPTGSFTSAATEASIRARWREPSGRSPRSALRSPIALSGHLIFSAGGSPARCRRCGGSRGSLGAAGRSCRGSAAGAPKSTKWARDRGRLRRSDPARARTRQGGDDLRRLSGSLEKHVSDRTHDLVDGDDQARAGRGRRCGRRRRWRRSAS